MAVWQYLQKRENREILRFVGAGAVAVIIGAWTLFTYIDDRKSEANTPISGTGESATDSDGANLLLDAANQAVYREYHGEGIDVAFAGIRTSSNNFSGELPWLVLEYVNFATKPVAIDMVLCNFNNWPVPNSKPPRTLNATVEIFPADHTYINLNPEEKKTVSYELYVLNDTRIHRESTISSCKITYLIKTSSNYYTTRTASVMLDN